MMPCNFSLYQHRPRVQGPGTLERNGSYVSRPLHRGTRRSASTPTNQAAARLLLEDQLTAGAHLMTLLRDDKQHSVLLGELLAGLLQLKDEDFKKMRPTWEDLVNLNNKEAELAFLKKILGTAGQGGAGGSLPAADETARDMMEALRSMEALPGPGEVLQLGANASFLFDTESNSLFVRECYPRLFDTLVLGSKTRDYIVTGTPGIGKSWFVYYLLARLLKSTQPPPFIVLEHLTQQGKAWCYTHATGEVVFGERTDFAHALKNPHTWYISDGVPPQLNSKAHIVLLTSPKRDKYKETHKANAEMLYMPLWTLDELLVCQRLLYSTVDEALAKELYQHYGGTVRYVLKHPTLKLELDKLLAELREAVAGCNTAQMQSSIASISTAPEASIHRLLHIVADENFQLQHLVFASKWVAEEFVKKAVRDEWQQLISLMSSMEGATKGMIYEPVMHSVLAQGGRFNVAPVNTDTLARVGQEVLELDTCTDTEFIKLYIMRGVCAQLKGSGAGHAGDELGEGKNGGDEEGPETQRPRQE